MKKRSSIIIVTLIVSVFAGACSLFGFKPSGPPGTQRQLGDVVYSVLAPAQFKEQHGDGWRLMDGTPFSSEDGLQKMYHPAVSPDARGVFVRGMNQGRDAGQGDQDGNRAVGVYQADAFKHHAHTVGYPYGANQFQGLFTNGAGTYQVDLGHNTSSTAETGGNETRPRNIALYVYIKVN